MKRLYSADDTDEKINNSDEQMSSDDLSGERHDEGGQIEDGYSITGGIKHYELAEGIADEEESVTRKAFVYLSYGIIFTTLIALCFFLYEVKSVLDDPNVPNNVFFLNENLGGTDYKNLDKALSGIALKISQRPIYLNASDRRFMVIASKDIDFKININAISDQVSKIGNEGNLFQRIKYRIRLKTGRMKVNIPCKYYFNKTRLENLSSSIAEYLSVSPRSATVVELDNGYKKIERESPGLRISPAEVYRQIKNELSNFNSPNFASATLDYEQIKPAVLIKDKLDQLNSSDLLSKFEAVYNIQNYSVRDNIEKTARRIDGLILKPLEVFSFNKYIGPVKYKNEDDAKIFNSNSMGFFPDISGGIGVFVSGLYNVALATRIEVLERYNHTSVDANNAYCSIGRDAHVIFGSKDLKFMVPKNSPPLIIFCEASAGRLNFSIYGQNKINETVSIETMEINAIAPSEKRLKDYSLKKGEEKIEQEGIPGYEAKTVKAISINGVENFRAVISTDVYAGVPKIVRVGDQAEE